MATSTSRRRTIPNKLYFRIGEVSDLVGVKPYVLRYWETEFGDVRPTKSKSGQRLYKRRDVELLLKVRELLYAQRYTIDGAKQRLRETMRENRGGSQSARNTGLVQQESLKIPSPQAGTSPVAGKDNLREHVADNVGTRRNTQRILLKLKQDLQEVLEEVRSIA